MTKQEAIKAAVDEYINSNYSVSLTKLQAKYGVKRQTISDRVKKLGYCVINKQNEARINQSIFDVIDTEDKAYWLGFLYADGCIYSSEKRLRVNLSIRDIDHLKAFATFLGFSGEIRTYITTLDNGNKHAMCSLSFRSKHIWDALNSKGCTPAKSLTLKFPDLSIFNGKDLVRHFIRGYVDGDGCLGLYTKKNTKAAMVDIVGTKEFLDGVNSYIAPLNGTISSKSSKSYKNNAYRLHYSGVGARMMARYLYENSTVYLQRKYDRYKEFCHFEEGSSRAKSSKIGEDWNC